MITLTSTTGSALRAREPSHLNLRSSFCDFLSCILLHALLSSEVTNKKVGQKQGCAKAQCLVVTLVLVVALWTLANEFDDW